MREHPIEQHFRRILERCGFEVPKLTTAGRIGTPDRLILRPKWSPGAPSVVECKRPGKKERKAQAVVRDDWRSRGVIVHDIVDSIERAEELASQLIQQAAMEAMVLELPPHIMEYVNNGRS